MKLEQFFDEILKSRHYPLVNSILVYKNDELLVERFYNGFNKQSKNNIKSIWKSIISLCIGICLDKGFIKSLDDPIGMYLEPFNENRHPYHKKLTIKHLLTMTSGIYWNGGVHYHCPLLDQLWREKDCVEHLADTAMSYLPGRKFVYKEWDVILLSAIITAVTSNSAYDFCNKYLYKPLEIESGKWATLSDDISYTISRESSFEAQSDLTARDLAKLGRLILRNGQGIVSSSYIRQAMMPSVCKSNYGYLLWLFNEGCSARGYGGQEVNVVPSEELIYVVQATPTDSSKSYLDVFDEFMKKIDEN